MVEHILEFMSLLVSDVDYINYYTTKTVFIFLNLQHGTKTILKSAFNSHVYWDTLYQPR